MSNFVYPYRVAYPRTSDWWEGRWQDLATWCDDTFGASEWEYYYSEFVFCKEEDATMFKLRWL